MHVLEKAEVQFSLIELVKQWYMSLKKGDEKYT